MRRGFVVLLLGLHEVSGVHRFTGEAEPTEDSDSWSTHDVPPASEIYRQGTVETNNFNTHKVDNIKLEMERIAPGSTKGLDTMLTKMNTKMEKLAPALKTKLEKEGEHSAEEHAAQEAPAAVMTAKGAAEMATNLDDNVASLRTQMSARTGTEGMDSAADETMAVAASTNKMIEAEAAKEQQEEKEMTEEVKRQDDIIAIATAAKKISQAKLKSLEAASGALKLGQKNEPAEAKPKQSLVEEETSSSLEELQSDRDLHQATREKPQPRRQEHQSSRRKETRKSDDGDDSGKLNELLRKITQMIGVGASA